MKTLLSTLLLTLSLSALAGEATYFRAWQGFQKPGLSNRQFVEELTPFLRETVDVYAGGTLNNYIVVMPPQSKPSFIPDEFALVALSSKEAYQAVRATAQGQYYGERHWDMFDKATSKSADPMVNFTATKPAQLVHNNSYDVIGKAINWQSGFNAVYIGIRKGALDKGTYLTRLASHVALAKKVMQPKGLKGYIVIANENYEVAYLNWVSKAAHDKAVASSEGQGVFKDAGEIMDALMYEEAKAFKAGSPIQNGKAYSTLPASN